MRVVKYPCITVFIIFTLPGSLPGNLPGPSGDLPGFPFSLILGVLFMFVPSVYLPGNTPKPSGDLPGRGVFEKTLGNKHI